MYNYNENSFEVRHPGAKRIYKFDVVETLLTCVSVEAEHLAEAYRKVNEAWNEGRIALTSMDNHAGIDIDFVEMTDEEKPSLKD